MYLPLLIPSIVTDYSNMEPYEFKYVGYQITQWIRQNDWLEELSFKKLAGTQFCFVRDQLGQSLGFETADVVATHMSKSCLLPVYFLSYKGLQLIIRDNFYNWKLSVNSPIDLDLDTDLFIKESEDISTLYCEGFKDEWVFGTYAKDHSKFTIELHNKYHVFALVHQIKSQYAKKLGIKN